MSVFGIDVDGTLALLDEWTVPDKIGPPNPMMVEVVKDLYKFGNTLCIWTCRADYVVEAWLEEHDLRKYFAFINKSPYITDSLKPSFDFYIGDEAVSALTTDPEHMHYRICTVQAHGTHIGVMNEKRDANFSSHAPVAFFAGTGRMYIDMFEQAWRDTWVKVMPCNKPVALLTICSHAKPYSKSFIHSTIRRELWGAGMLDQTMYAHISTAGIVPADAEMVYPFNAYDHDGTLMTDEAKRYFSEITYKRIWDWLMMYSIQFEKVIFYLRGEGKTYNAAVTAVEDCKPRNVVVIGANMSIPQLPWAALPDVDDCLTSTGNLSRLIGAY